MVTVQALKVGSNLQRVTLANIDNLESNSVVAELPHDEDIENSSVSV